MFDSLARIVTRRGWIVLVAWAVVGGLLWGFAPRFRDVSQDDNVRFFPPEFPTVIGQDLVEEGFPGNVAASTFVVVGERPAGLLNEEDARYLDGITAGFRKLQEEHPEFAIKSVTDRRTPIIGTRLVGRSTDGGEAALISVALLSTFVSKQSRITVDHFEEFLHALPSPPDGLHVAWTGSAAVGHDQNTAANQSMERTTYATITLVVLILLLVYRSPVLALIPMTSIGLSVFVGLRVIASMAYLPWPKFQVINIAQLFVVVVLFGAGTDYCLFLIARYREELARGRTPTESLVESIRQVSGALVASAATVVVGLGMLYFSRFDKVRYTGPAIGVCLAIALLSAISLTPVLLSWLHRVVFWPFPAPHHEAGRDPEQESLAAAPAAAFWGKVADFVVRHPVWTLTASLAPLVPLAVVGYQTRPNYSQLADLHPTTPSVVGARTIKSYFPVGELGTSWILLEHPQVDFRSEAGAKAIEALAVSLAELENVAEVRAVSRPLGKPLGAAPATEVPKESGGLLGGLGRFLKETQKGLGGDLVRAGADSRYVSTVPANPKDKNHITRVEVVYQSDPFSPESMATLREVEAVARKAIGPDGPLAGAVRLGLSGATAEVNDLETVTIEDQRRMYVLVTIGVFLILLVLLKRPGISLYLIATVILGYLATLGVTELVFKALHTGADPWIGLDWKVGFFLFVILIAVGEDYNILLMARVIEEQDRHGPIEGTRQAVAHTGGIISSCGLIMAGTFIAMLTSSLNSFKELGFALALGVMLDTFVVRPMMVPAFLVILHRLRPAGHLVSPIHPSDEPQSQTATTR